MDTERPASFGMLLRHFRQAAALSQEELAERAGLTAPAIGALERGERRRPYPRTLQALAGALGLAHAERAALFSAASGRGPSGDARAAAEGHEASRRPATVPTPLTPLVGRGGDVALVCGLLQSGSARLVTLTGCGGVGKTRLAVEIARMLQQRYTDGSVWVDLAPIREPDLVPTAVARALGLVERADQSIVEVLESYLRHRELLITLDNFEHLQAAAPAIPALLERCPRLALLITGREALRVRGEHEVQVLPLALPDQQVNVSADSVARSEAGDLFLQRVRAVRPAFALTEADAPAVAAICARLDGIPLALELAAVQLRYVSPAMLRDRLHDRLLLSDGVLHDMPARQRSLRATLDWSHELLSGQEQELFRGLAVFAGGSTRQAAELVCGAGCPPEQVPRLLAALVDKSLVRAIPDADGEMRFVMLETIHEYARARLQASGEERWYADRHAAYICELAEAAEPHLTGPARQEWLLRLECEADNVRAALAWTTTRGDRCVGLRLAGAVAWMWLLRGSISEGAYWMDHLLSEPSAGCGAGPRAAALYCAAAIAWKRQDNLLASQYVAETVDLWRQMGNGRRLALALAVAGHVAASSGDLERARTLHEESLARFKEQGHRWGIAYALANLGDVFVMLGHPAEAQHVLQESLQRFNDIGDTWGHGIVLHALGTVASAQARVDEARAHFSGSIAQFRAIGNWENVGRGLLGLAALLLGAGERDEARRLLTESVTIWSDLGDRTGAALSIAGLAACAAARGRFQQAARLYGAAGAHGGARPALYLVETAIFWRWLQETKAHLGEPLATTLWAEGAAMEIDGAVALAGHDSTD